MADRICCLAIKGGRAGCLQAEYAAFTALMPAGLPCAIPAGHFTKTKNRKGIWREWEASVLGAHKPEFIRFVRPKSKDKLLYPLCHKDVGISGTTVEAVGGEDKIFAVEGKHGEAVESIVEGHLFQTCAVRVDGEDIELVAALTVVVAGEEYPLSIRVHIRRPVGFAEIGDLPHVGAV